MLRKFLCVIQIGNDHAIDHKSQGFLAKRRLIVSIILSMDELNRQM
jgi:hypothetical protein